MTTTNSSWIFPDVSLYGDIDLNNPDVKIIREKTENQMEIFEKQLAEKDEQIKQLQASIEELTSCHQKKLESITDIVDQINSSVPEINAKFKKTLDATLTEAAHKFLFGEMTKNNKVLKNIINKIIGELDAKKIAVIEISVADYQILNAKKVKNIIKIQPNESLNPGEIIIQYNDQMLMMNLSEMIRSEISGVNYD